MHDHGGSCHASNTISDHCLCRRSRADLRERRREGPDLQVRLDATRLHQSHHQLRHLQGAEGKGRSQHPGAGRRQIRDDCDRRPRRGRFRHGERAGDRDGTRQRRAAQPAHDRRGLYVEDRLLGAQGQQHARRLRSARQARDDGLLRHARARSAVARILATGGLTEKDIKPVLVPNVVRSADDFRRRRGRHVHVRVRRAEGARGRRDRRRHPHPGDPRVARNGGGAQFRPTAT